METGSLPTSSMVDSIKILFMGEANLLLNKTVLLHAFKCIVNMWE